MLEGAGKAITFASEWEGASKLCYQDMRRSIRAIQGYDDEADVRRNVACLKYFLVISSKT